MVRHFNIKNMIYSFLVFFGYLSCLAQDVQAFKVVNEIGAELDYSHTIPSDTTAYLHVVSNKIPRAYITSWFRGSHGTTKECRELDRRKPLPTWVRIAFSQEVSQLFVDEFFMLLKATHKIFKDINPRRHGKFTSEFVITVPPNYTQQEVEVFLEQVHIAMQKRQLLKNAEPVKTYAVSDEVIFTPSANTDTLKCEITNNSNITVGAFITWSHSGDFLQPTIVFPYQAATGIESLKHKRMFISTLQGTYLLGPDNVRQPTQYLLRQYVSDGNQNSRIVQQLPFKFLEKISIQVDYDGSVSMTDHSKEGYYV